MLLWANLVPTAAIFAVALFIAAISYTLFVASPPRSLVFYLVPISLLDAIVFIFARAPGPRFVVCNCKLRITNSQPLLAI